MSIGRQILREFGQAVRDGAKGGVLASYHSEYERGYCDAAQVCMGVLSDATDGLLAKMKSGNLSKQEQALYARLTELAAEMDERIRNSCQPAPTADALP